MVSGRRRVATALALLWVAACSASPVEPRLPELEVVVAGGDGQYGTSGVDLPHPMRVVVRSVETKLPAADIDVQWTVVSGDASIMGADVRVTNDAGAAEVQVRLGSAEGEISIEATVVRQAGATATLRSFLVGTPELTAVEPALLTAGGTVVLDGQNFSPVPEQNTVLFSGIRGRVTNATPTRLEVEVPACLPPRSALGVRTALGVVSSDSLSVAVESQVEPLTLPVGGYIDLVDPRGLDCVRLSGAGAAGYLAVPHSWSTLAAALHPLRVTGLAYDPTQPIAVGPAGADLGDRAGATTEPHGSAQERFELRLRLEEKALIEERDPVYPMLREPLAGPAATPWVGQSRSFFVYNGSTDSDLSARYDQITATVRYVGAKVAIFVDNESPASGFTDEDLQDLADRFDEVIHPTVTQTFGTASDIDGNERVAVLFTPVVNRLTPRASNSFVGGFFFGRDLMPELSYSNKGEVFYALVPDEAGEHGDPRTRNQVVTVVPAILAHEFQHMVHYNQRVLQRGGSQDALWMLEGLAQMAEELVARIYDGVAAWEEAELFRDGNRRRARLYLERPDTTSLIVSSGRGTLAERGAGFLFLLYLHQQHGGDLLGRLTRTTVTGVANAELETGKEWSELLPDWAAAMYLDGSAAGAGALMYPNFHLRGFLETSSPFQMLQGGTNDFLRSETLPSSSLRYYVLNPPDGGSLSVALGGVGGGDWPVAAALGLRLVRIR
jgi:hypothetical protein